MTQDELRRMVIEACDKGISHPHAVGAQNVKLLKAMRQLFSTNDAALIDLMAIVSAHNSSEKEE